MAFDAATYVRISLRFRTHQALFNKYYSMSLGSTQFLPNCVQIANGKRKHSHYALGFKAIKFKDDE